MSGYLSDELYDTVTKNVPIICVDTIPVIYREGKHSVGMIVRATGSQAQKLTILGGRVYHSESIDEAIFRHLRTDLGIGSFTHIKGFKDSQPFLVQQYFMQEQIDSEVDGFDPTKHAIALTYLLEIDSAKIVPQNEALDIIWISEKINDYSSTGFNQAVVINKALDFLATK